jgi:hypothetical protein
VVVVAVVTIRYILSRLNPGGKLVVKGIDVANRLFNDFDLNKIFIIIIQSAIQYDLTGLKCGKLMV